MYYCIIMLSGCKCVLINWIQLSSTLKSVLSQISNMDILNVRWLQASLPIRQAGLRIRQVHSLALPTFWPRRRAPQTSRRRSCCRLPALPIRSLRPTWHLDRMPTSRLHSRCRRHSVFSSPGRGTLFWATTDSPLPCCCHTSQRRLAFSTVHL